MFIFTDYAFLEQIWDPLTVNPKDLILTKPNPISKSQEANILSPYIDDFQYNYGLNVVIVKAIDIVFKNMNASINDIDIDNILLQNFLYKFTLSTDYLNLKEFEGN
jgi:hypothetical protein